jgi:hypothetical protein
MRPELIKNIAVTFELCGATTLSQPAMEMVIRVLDEYPPHHVTMALNRCLQECKNRLSLADIIERIPNERPGADEAWAMLPRSEADSVVWTEEMAAAYGVVRHEIDRDPTAARMAFREAYRREVQKAKDNKIKTAWAFSPGTDPAHRKAVLSEAVEKGRISSGQAVKILPEMEVNGHDYDQLPESDEIKKLIGKVLK